MTEVFISYARQDQGFARDLHAALKKLKRHPWIDWRDIPDSAKWRAEIFTAIEESNNFLLILSPDSLQSEMCRLEVAHALANRKRVISILYHPVDRKALFEDLGEIQWISYPELGFEKTFQRLLGAIDTDLEWVREHTRLAWRARYWERKRSEDLLLRGIELQEAINWQKRAGSIRKPKLLPLHEEYIKASRMLAQDGTDPKRPLTLPFITRIEQARREKPFFDGGQLVRLSTATVVKNLDLPEQQIPELRITVLNNLKAGVKYEYYYGNFDDIVCAATLVFNIATAGLALNSIKGNLMQLSTT